MNKRTRCCSNCEHLRKFSPGTDWAWYICRKLDYVLDTTEELLEIRADSVETFHCKHFKRLEED